MKPFLDICLTLIGILVSRFYDRFCYLSESELKKYQSKLIKKQISYSIKNISFYKKLNIKLGEDPYETLKDFPIISKKDILKDPCSFRPKNLKTFFSSIHHTSGVSGEIIRSDCSPKSWILEQAAIWNHWRTAGYRFRDKMLILRGFNPVPGRPLYKKDNFRNWLYYSPRHLDEKYLNKNIEKIFKFSPKFIRGYPSSIKQFAIYCLNKNISLPNIKSIFTASETLTEDDRALIEKVFSAKIFDHYGQAEISCLFQECEQHNGLHLIPYYSFVEFIPDKKGNYKIIATNLNNKFMPLIRYDTGDLVEDFSLSKCKSGRTTARVPSIKGRSNLFLNDKNHKLIPATSLITFLSTFPYLRKFQFIEKKSQGIEFIYESDEKIDIYKLKNYLKNIFGKKIKFYENRNFHFTKEGKFSSVVIINE